MRPDPIVPLVWDDGVLRTASPDLAGHSWTRPADLAAARLAVLPAPEALELADGHDLLAAAFGLVPFARGPLPAPVYGAGVTAAARAAFDLFLGRGGESDRFRVLRGELDDFLVCARLRGDTWTVGAFAAEPTTLTVRFEDLWRQLPANARRFAYAVDVVRDPHAKDPDDARTAGVVRETVGGLAPDARVCLDVAQGGGCLLDFRPATTGGET